MSGINGRGWEPVSNPVPGAAPGCVRALPCTMPCFTVYPGSAVAVPAVSHGPYEEETQARRMAVALPRAKGGPPGADNLPEGLDVKKGGSENSQGRKTHFSAIRLCFQAAARGGLLWSVRNSRLPQGGAAACRFASGKSKIFRVCEFAESAFIYPGRFRLAAMISAMAKSSG